MTRRSIRRFSDQEVGDEILTRIFEAVRMSPSWANMQCWRFIVVRNAKIKEKLSELSYVESFLSPLGYKVNPAKKGLTEAPVVIVACADPSKSGTLWEQHYYLTDMGIATQNLMLAAHDLGLGSVFVGVFDEDIVRKLLGIPKEIRVVGLLPLGYPKDEKKNGPPRKTLGEIMSKEKWAF